MPQLISLIIAIVIFAIVAYGLKWVCDSFSLPAPVLWLCGAVLLIILLIWISGQLGVAGSDFTLFPRR
jgi:ABC-type transport system involved in cytochrome c biogenesis permease subunit